MAARQEKAPGAFRTISEVADEIDAPQHVLRFWESKFSQLKPVKRGGGRRYYRPEDVDLLRAIRKLLYEDKFTIKGAQKLLREQGVRKVVSAYMEGEGAAIGPVVAGRPAAANGVDRNPEAGIDKARLRGLLEELKGAQALLQGKDN